MLSDSTKPEMYIYEVPASGSSRTAPGLDSRWLELGLGLVLIGLGLGLRLYDLAGQPLWYDETFNLALVQNLPFRDALTYYQPWLVHPPLFLAVMNRWLHYFGQEEFTLRFFSVLMGTALLPVVYLIVRRWIDRRVALTGLLLIAISSLQIYISQTIRPYAWLTLLIALSMGLALFAVERPEQSWRWLLYSLSAILMIYVHYLGFHIIFVQIIFFGVALYKNPAALVKAGLSVVLAGVSFLPWLDHFLAQSKFYGNSLDNLANGGLPKLLESFQFLSGWYVSGYLVFATGAVCLPLYGLGLVWLWRTRRNLAILLAGWSYLPFITCWLSSLIAPNFNQLRLTFCGPGFLIIVAAGLWSLAVPTKKASFGSAKPWVALGLLAVLTFSATINYYQNYRNQDWRGLANYIATNRQPKDFIYLANLTGDTKSSFDYYYVYKLGAPGQLERLYLPTRDNPEKTVPALFQGHDRAWVVYWDTNNDWLHQGVLPNVPPEFKQVFYKEFPDDQGGIVLLLLAKSP